MKNKLTSIVIIIYIYIYIYIYVRQVQFIRELLAIKILNRGIKNKITDIYNSFKLAVVMSKMGC